MRAKIATLAAFLSLPTVPASACSPMEGDVFDELSSPNLVLAIANVIDVKITQSSAEKSCVEFGYSRSEVISGTIDESFRVEMCGNDGPIAEEDLAETPDPYGFTKGATVLVGVIKAEGDSSKLRYVVPNCWGPMHLRLDDMSETERDTFIAEIKQAVAEARGAAEP